MLARSFLAVVCLSFGLGTVASAGTYSDPERHFYLTLPPQWKKMSKQELDAINALAKQRLSFAKVEYIAGFRRSFDKAGTFPYILVQSVEAPPKGSSYAEIERAIAGDLKAPIKLVQGQMKDLVGDIEINKPVLDRSRNLIVMRTEMELKGIGTAKGISYGHIGSGQVVFLHCYGKDKGFEALIPTFSRVSESFDFDQGYAFKAGTGSGFQWTRSSSGMLIGGFVGLVVAMVGYLINRTTKTA